MEISTLNPGYYFTLFYLLAFAFIFSAVIVFSIRRGYHLRSVLLMLTTITLFTIIGSRLFTIPVSEWGNIIYSGSVGQYNNRSAIGGLIFGLIGLIISQRLFRFNRPILDLYAWIVPVGMGIQKIGCFINGCCYGKPSELFWSVQYPKGTHAHFNQWSTGMLNGDLPFSLNVHPVQLYETLFLFVIGYIVWRTHHLWKKNASSLLFGLFLFFSFRFLIEFIRDPDSSQFNVHYLNGIRVFQWFILAMGLIMGLLLIIYEKYLKAEIVKGSQSSPYLSIDVFYIFTISIILYLFDGLFTRFELIALWMKFLPAILLTLYYLYTDSKVQKYRLAASFLFLIPFYVMSQSVQTDSSKVKKYKRIDVGGSFGSFFNQVRFNPQQNECGTSYSSEYYKHLYQVGGAGISQIINKDNNITSYGVNLHLGNNKTINLTTNEEKSHFIFGVNPYIKYDMNWFGAGIGMQVGSLRKNTNEELNETTIKNALKNHTILPEFYLRLGRRDIVDIDYNYGFLFPSPYPSLNQRISIGSGFGNKTDYSLRYGRFLPLESSFISAEGLISKQVGINLMYIFNEELDFYEEQSSKGKFVFGLNYRFGN